MLFFEQTLNSTSGSSQRIYTQQTGCLHYGRHDIFMFFQNMAQLHIITKTNLSEQNEPVNGNDVAAKK